MKIDCVSLQILGVFHFFALSKILVSNCLAERSRGMVILMVVRFRQCGEI